MLPAFGTLCGRHGSAINQLDRGLQTATRALRDGASDLLVIAALCHDIETAISMANHPAIAAEIRKPFVSPDVYDIVRTHQEFPRRHYHAEVGKDPEGRRRYLDQAWYEMACRFSDEWDQTSFDPSSDHLPLEYFEPLIDPIGRQGGARGEAAVMKS